MKRILLHVFILIFLVLMNINTCFVLANNPNYYIEYDDQGILVEKHNIIIAEGEGISGSSEENSGQEGSGYNETAVQGNTTVDPGETIATTETTKKNWGVKVDNAQYYDYVEYDGQGRRVKKNNIIIAEGSGTSGSGGGSGVESVPNSVVYGVSSKSKSDDEILEEKLLESVENRIFSTKTKDKENKTDNKGTKKNLFDFVKNFFGKFSANTNLKIILPETPYYVKSYPIEIVGWEYESKKNNNNRFDVTITCLVKKIARKYGAYYNIKLKNDVGFVVLSFDDWYRTFDEIKVGEIVEKKIKFDNVPYSDYYDLIIE